jgi:hypothetical protein
MEAALDFWVMFDGPMPMTGFTANKWTTDRSREVYNYPLEDPVASIRIPWYLAAEP